VDGGMIIVMKIILIILLFILLIISSSYAFAKPDKIFLEDLNSIGKFIEIENFPEKMFEGGSNSSPEQRARRATEKIAYYFVTKKRSLKQYPQNMMKAMAYFEVFYLNKLDEAEGSIERFKSGAPNNNDLLKLNSLMSLNKAKKSMRNAVGLSLEDDPEEAIKTFWVMNEYLSMGKGKTNTIDNKITKKQKELTKFKTNITSLKNILQKRVEERIDHAKYKKEVKRIIPKIIKNINKIKKHNIENQEYSRKLGSKESIVINDEQMNKNISHIEKIVNEINKNIELSYDSLKTSELSQGLDSRIQLANSVQTSLNRIKKIYENNILKEKEIDDKSTLASTQLEDASSESIEKKSHSNDSDYEEKLENLKKLFDKELITKEEYDEKRKKIIDANF
jgi:hypothetical protein